MLDGCTPWPAQVARHYREQGYWLGDTLSALLHRWVTRFADHTALVHGDERITYAELDWRVERMAAGFTADGLVAGDRVIVQLPNCGEFVIACFALFRIDAKPVFSLLAHRVDEISHLCEASGAVAYIGPGQHRGFDYTTLAIDIMGRHRAVRRAFVLDGSLPAENPDGVFRALAEVDADPGEYAAADPTDVAFFLLSGGTTALPKLIPRTHDDYAYQIRAAAQLLNLGPDDVYLAVLPIEFNFAWGCPGVLGTLCTGGTVVLLDGPDPLECFDTIEAERVTLTSLVPTLAQLWLEAAETFAHTTASLRTIQIGGAPLPRTVADQIAPTFGCVLQQVFGMAEGLLSLTRTTDGPATTVGTQGRPLSPADEIRIVDENQVELPTGTTGELQARGPYTLRGYYRAATHNATAFTADGFYRTGDRARLTEDGNLVISGRIKDVIIRAGNKIAAAEVEGHLLSQPGVDRAAVVGVPDRYLGERICAYIKPSGDPPDLVSLRAALHARGIADYKLPDRLVLVTDLPLTGLGKVDKNALAADAASRAGAPPSPYTEAMNSSAVGVSAWSITNLRTDSTP